MKYRKDPFDFEKTIEDNGELRAAIEAAEDADTEKKPANAAVTVLVIVLFASALILMGAFAETNIAISGMIMGLLFVVLGTMGAVKGFRSGNLLILVFPIIGAGIFTVSALIAFGSEHTRGIAAGLIPYAILAIFFIVGLLLIISRILIGARKKRECTESVTAQCVMHKCHIDHNDDTPRSRVVICPVFRYRFEGVEYIAQEDNYSNVCIPALEEEVELFVNPLEPYEIHRPAAMRNALYYGLGVGFMALPVIILVVLISVA